MRKKGQSAGNAAGLILVVGLLIVLYILLVPEQVRNEMLDENQTGEGPDIGTPEYGNLTLLHASPKRLDYLRFDHYEHPLSAFTLYRTTESKQIEEFNAFNIKNNVFEKKDKQVDFQLSDVAHTDDAMLSFQVSEHRGMLTVLLNGETIYENEIQKNNPEPIELPYGLLKTENSLTFKVSSVGWKFWETNEYTITNAQITADITDVSRQKSENVFYVGDSEHANLERAVLKFSPECQQSQVGVLEISINGHQVFSGVPDCGMLNVKNFPPNYLEQGENYAVFQTNQGTYLIDLIKIETELEELTYPVYYFDLTDRQFQDLQEGLLDVYVTMEFVDTGEDRKAILLVNGKPKYVESEGLLYTTKVPYDAIRPVNNWVKVEPDADAINIANLIVELKPR